MAPNRVLGSPEAWLDTFPDDLIPEILQLVFDAWKKLSRANRREREVPITTRLCARLRQEKVLRALPVHIWTETPELDPETGEELGRIDLRFMSLTRAKEEVCFAFECKRLNVTYGHTPQSQADKYISHGMVRFINGAYTNSMPRAGMLAYVMDGKLATARKAVDSAIRARCRLLCISPPDGLRASPLTAKGRRVEETRHTLGAKVLTLYHVFLPY